MDPKSPVRHARFVPAIRKEVLSCDRRVLAHQIAHFNGQDLLERAVAKRLHRRLDELLKALFVLNENTTCLPRKIAEWAQQHDGLDVTIPIRRRVELHLDITQTVPLQNQAPEPERSGSGAWFCRGTVWVISRCSSTRRRIGIVTSRPSCCWAHSAIFRGRHVVFSFKTKRAFRSSSRRR